MASLLFLLFVGLLEVDVICLTNLERGRIQIAIYFFFFFWGLITDQVKRVPSFILSFGCELESLCQNLPRNHQ